MEEIYQGQEIYEDEDRDVIQEAIKAKKEKFRIQIRQSKNKQLIQQKRMKLLNGQQHQPKNYYEVDKQDNQGFKNNNKEYEIQLSLLKENIKILLSLNQHSKQQAQVAVDSLIAYLLDGSYNQDIEQLTQISSTIQYLIVLGQQPNCDFNDQELAKSALALLLNITYYCDQQQMKYFSNQDIMNSLLQLLYSESMQIREYCLTTINNIIQEDVDNIKFLMERFIAQEIISLVTTYPISNEIVLDLSSIIKQIVIQSSIVYSEATEFLIPIDELIEIHLSSQLNEESDNTALNNLLESIYTILNKEDSEDIYENFVLEYQRLLANMIEIVKQIQLNQKFNSIAINISQIFGLLLSGNIKTTQILVQNDIFESLKILIKHPKKEVRSESMWAVSNLFVFSNVEGLKEYLSDLIFWESILDSAFQDHKSVRKWAYVSILNALIINDIEFIEIILERFPESDLIKFIFEKIEDKDYQNVLVSLLEAVKSLISYGEYCQNQNNYEENHILSLIQRINSKQIIQQIQNNPDNDLYSVSSYLLDKIQ
ncbi:armadillo/beta-catenin repeat protein (macronuclear) [Tetrahymena thermophila SB210]|uniref:Armadillo/beta-catenin repeat protein n=1 Tax=Tetrahymena thermophila (strain SB210) TaxID=312017 RepID=Q22DP9_TETTS|nr:armadillo/beta-catenin repeat protein [Tetrahymena thermophila SB210]EAR83405.2 armadillo/beta-catenin repeat protein [Tetrahymena thermophila SB210]|eukprot:XP_001031068.2 armadillo/beta-catenin repeat protein [Tetrahymena thermophila SB210]